MLDNLKQRLKQWKEVTAREFLDRPDLLALIPNTDKIDIKKLTDGCITTNTCNPARKTRRILVDIVSQIDGGVHRTEIVVRRVGWPFSHQTYNQLLFSDQRTTNSLVRPTYWS